MRIRRCVGRTTHGKHLLPGRPTSVVRLVRKYKPIESQPAPKPQRYTTELHPNSVSRTGLGCFKYATGLLQSKSRDHRAAALKVYSTEPISHKTWQQIYTSAVRAETATKDVSANSLFAGMLASALKPYDDLGAVQDVHYQVFGSSKDFLADLTRRERIVVDQQSWDVLLCLHRSASESGKLRTPTFQLRTPWFKLEKSGIGSDKSRWIPQVKILIAVHLKVDLLGTESTRRPLGVSTAESGQSIREFVKQLILQVTASVKEGMHEDVNEVLLSIQGSLERWLPTSDIATYVDLNDCEITITDEALRRRYVSNTLLNANCPKRMSGTDRPPHVAGRAERGIGHDADSGSLGTERSIDIPCHESSSNEFTSKCNADLSYNTGGVIGVAKPPPSSVLQRFRELCSKSKPIALSDYAAASLALTQQYPQISGTITMQEHMIREGELSSIGYPLGALTIGLTSLLNHSKRLGDIRISLPPLRLPRSGKSSALDPPRVNIRLHGRYKRNTSSAVYATTEHVPLSEEARRLSQISAIIVQRIWKELDVDTYQIAAQTMAEALLRVVDFKESCLTLCGVRVTTSGPSADGLEKMYHAHAFKTLPETGAQSRASAVEKVYHSPISGSSLGAKSSAEVPAESVSVPPNNQVEAEYLNTSTASDIRLLSDGSAVLRESPRASTTIAQLLGLDKLSFALRWIRVSGDTVPEMSVQAVRELAEKAITDSSENGLRSVLQAWWQLKHIHPAPELVTLAVRGNPMPAANVTASVARAFGSLTMTVEGGLRLDGPELGAPIVRLGMTSELKVSVAQHPQELPFAIEIKGRATDGVGSLPASQLVEMIGDVVIPLITDRQHASLKAFTRAVTDAMQQQDSKLLRIFGSKDVGINFNLPGGRNEMYWGSGSSLDATGDANDWEQDQPSSTPGSNVTISKGLVSIIAKAKSSTALHHQLGMQNLGFRLAWDPDHSSEVSSMTAPDLRQQIERRVLQTKGPQCMRVALDELSSIEPAPEIVSLTVGSTFTTRQGGQISVSLGMTKGHQFLTATLYKVFETSLDSENAVARYDVQLRGIIGDEGDPTTAMHFVDTVVGTVRSAALAKTFSDINGLLLAVRDSIYEQSQQIAAFLRVEDVALIVDLSGTGSRQKFFWASKLAADSVVEDGSPMSTAMSDESAFIDQPNSEDETLSTFEENSEDDNEPRLSTEGTASDLASGEETNSAGDDGRQTDVSSVCSLSRLSILPQEPDEAPAQQLEGERKDQRQQRPAQPTSPILIALGSNVGDRLACIEEACRALDAEPDIRILNTSSLYETKAMYIEDQAPFLNGVCEIETSLSPIELLDRTQAIEQGLGRVKTIDKGPRNIDLDILLYRNTVMKTERLTIPHPLMLERHFVLGPMNDIAPARRLKHPTTRQSFQHHLERLKKADTPMYPFVPLGAGRRDFRPNDRNLTTSVMSILNVTPDSFSDGGENEANDAGGLRSIVRSHIAGGASIIDIGGQSSRPNAPDVTAEEEIRRVLPAIEAIKSLPEAAGIAISVDTYRAAVAKAAIDAGAHIINDVSAGQLDPEMLPTVARLGCTYIMMHMRGTPATMMAEENCTYPDGGLLATIRAELIERVDAAQRAGIRRWRLVVDPGIGFSKTTTQNVTVLRRLGDLRRRPHLGGNLAGLPMLVGTSRKSFIGRITGVDEPKARVWGTAATVTEAVRGGAEIVRVHDVAEMAKVVKMADAIYRRRAFELDEKST